MEEKFAENQQVLMEVLDDLVRAGFIKRHLLKEAKTGGIEGLEIEWTESGDRFMRDYARAFFAVWKCSSRREAVFHVLLQRFSVNFMGKRKKP